VLLFLERVALQVRSTDVDAIGAENRKWWEKTPLFAPFIYKSHDFTKTGSGQT
jgi:hypothetical protein